MGHRYRHTLQELLHKRPLWPRSRGQENTHDMIILFPRIHSFLVVLTSLQHEVVDHANVGDMTVLLKPLSDGMSNESRCNT